MMSWFHEKLDSLTERLKTRDKAFLASVAGCVAGAALLTPAAPVAMAGVVAAEGVGAFTAFKIGEKVLGRLLAGSRDANAALASLDPVTRERAQRFLENTRRWREASAVAHGDTWLVRDERSDRFRRMDKEQFAAFEADVAGRGGILNKVSVSDDHVVAMRYRSGKLDGDRSYAPAVREFTPEQTTRRFAVLGVPVPRPADDPELALAAGGPRAA